MTIITDKIKNTIKNRLIKKLENFKNDLLKTIFDSLFIEENRYLKMMTNLETSAKSGILSAIKLVLEESDKIYCETEERKNNYHISSRRVNRSIMTIFGVLEYRRNYYKSIRTSKCFYFADLFLNIPKGQRYDNIIKALAIEKSVKFGQKPSGELVGENISSLNRDKKIDIPRQTIHRWIQEWKVPEFNYSPKKHSEELYVMIDEKFIHEQIKIKNRNLKGSDKKEKKRNFIMSKAFVVFTNIDKQKNRSNLQNRFVFLTSKKNAWDSFLNQICKIYDFSKIKNIYALSDAGNWIVSGIDDLKLYEQNIITKCLCEFHFKQTINRITRNKEKREKLISLVESNRISDFKLELKSLKNDNPKRIEKLQKYENYVIKNWKKIHNTKNIKYGSSMEAQISHHLAKNFTSRPKGYSKTSIEKYLKLQEYISNGVDIFTLYLETSKNNYSNSSKINFSIFDKENLPIPLLRF